MPNNHAERVSGDVVGDHDVGSKRTKFVQSQEESGESMGNNNGFLRPESRLATGCIYSPLSYYCCCHPISTPNTADADELGQGRYSELAVSGNSSTS